MQKNIPLRVKNLINRHFTNNPFEIAENLKIKVMFGETPKGINGLRKTILRRKFIYINEKLEEWQQKAVLCHELAHFVLKHPATSFCAGQTYFAYSHFEDEADEFATELFFYSSDIDLKYVKLFLKEGYKYN